MALNDIVTDIKEDNQASPNFEKAYKSITKSVTKSITNKFFIVTGNFMVRKNLEKVVLGSIY